MDKESKEEFRRLEFERINREARIRHLLEANERQLEKEIVERSKEVDILLKHLERVNQELRKHTLVACPPSEPAVEVLSVPSFVCKIKQFLILRKYLNSLATCFWRLVVST